MIIIFINRDNQDEGNNRIYNIQPIKQNEIFRDETNNNINQITFGLDSNILEQINNINNNFNNLTIPNLIIIIQIILIIIIL